MPRLRGRPLPRLGRSPSAVLTASSFLQRKMGPSQAGMARAMQSSRSTTLEPAPCTRDWQWLSPACCATYLVVANFHSGLIEPYTQAFIPLAPPGSFTDPNLPAGYAPFNIQ